MQEQKVSGDWGVKMAAAHGCSSNEGFVMSVEYLLMRAYQPNLAYAFEKKDILEFTSDAARIGGISVQGEIIRPISSERSSTPFTRVLSAAAPFDEWSRSPCSKKSNEQREKLSSSSRRGGGLVTVAAAVSAKELSNAQSLKP